MSSVEGTPTSVEVGAVVVETSAQKSAASKEWHETLSHDAERKTRALKRSETFKAEQRFFHDKHGEGSVVSRSADGIVVMKFDNGEVHKYDLISQRKLRPIIEDAHTYTAETLFDIVDTDSSGVLEKAEFVYMHTMVLNSEKRAAAKIADAERNEAEQRRAKRLVMWALLVAVVMIFVLLGGMIGIFALVLFFYFGLGLIAVAFFAKFYREVVGATRWRDLNFTFTGSTLDWVKLLVVDALLVVFTFGIGLVFLSYRHWKFFMTHLEASGEILLDELTQSQTRTAKHGEGLLDAFDMGAI